MSDCSVALGAVTPMSAQAATRMRAAGSVLSGLPRDEHNTLVGALAKRAAPVSQWGAVLADDNVEKRVASLRTGDLVLTSTRAMSWVGNTVQILTDSTCARASSSSESSSESNSPRSLPGAFEA